MKSTEELIDDLRDIANCQMEQPEKRNLLEAADRLEELTKELETANEKLKFLSWSNGRQTNG